MDIASNPRETFVGRVAPDFEVECTSTPQHPTPFARLRDYRDRWLVLMFYPQDFSFVCPTELSAMSDRYDEFAAQGTDVLAMSTDPIESHKRWIAMERSLGGLEGIRFPLGSDPTGEVAQAYGVFAPSQRLALRGLFIIDPNSVLQYHVVHNLSTGRRTDEVLRTLKALQMGGLCPENWMPGQPAIDPAAAMRPGNVIAHYRIEEQLGVGGAAVVYRAYDRVLERHVALKMLKRLDDKTPAIHEEARTAAALNHLNICTVYSIDKSEGRSMIVMEYLVGRTLSALIADGPTPPANATPIARQIAAGMGAAHAAGIVHGDLKPGNVMLTDQGLVKILDFGLAGRRRVPDTSDSTVVLGTDRPGTILGTPSYMSPEQAEGASATAASDVFSFGLILYELLTGERAFNEPSVLQVLTQIRSIDPSRFADRVDTQFRPLLQQMLVRDRRGRTITMHDVEECLRETRTSPR